MTKDIMAARDAGCRAVDYTNDSEAEVPASGSDTAEHEPGSDKKQEKPNGPENPLEDDTEAAETPSSTTKDTPGDSADTDAHARTLAHTAPGRCDLSSRHIDLLRTESPGLATHGRAREDARPDNLFLTGATLPTGLIRVVVQVLQGWSGYHTNRAARAPTANISEEAQRRYYEPGGRRRHEHEMRFPSPRKARRELVSRHKDQGSNEDDDDPRHGDQDDSSEIPRPSKQLDRDHPAHDLATFYEHGGPVDGAGPKAYTEYCLIVRALVSRYGKAVPAKAIKDALSDEAEKEISRNGGPSEIDVTNDHLRRTKNFQRDGADVYMNGPTEYEIGQGVKNLFEALPRGADPKEVTDAIADLAEHGNRKKLDALYLADDPRHGDQEEDDYEEDDIGLGEWEGSVDIDPDHGHEDEWLEETNSNEKVRHGPKGGEDRLDDENEGTARHDTSQNTEQEDTNPDHGKDREAGPEAHQPTGKNEGTGPTGRPRPNGHHSDSHSAHAPRELLSLLSRPTTTGFDNRPPLTPENRRSERSDLISQVDICFVNPPSTPSPNGPAERVFEGGSPRVEEAPVKGRCTREQWGWLAPRARSQGEQWMFLRLVERARACQYESGSGEDDGWLVMSSEELHEDYGISYPTERAWRGSSLIEVWEDGEYVSPEEAKRKGTEPEARKFRVREEALREWTRLGAEGGSRRYKAHRRELVRTRKPQPMTTDLYDENRNDIPGLVKEALEVLMEADHELRLDAIEEAEKEIAQREGAEARHQLTSLRLAKEATKRQVIGEQAGVATLQNAYKIQKVSGRISFKRGGPQGLMQEIKAAAYDLEKYRNFDIRSCHTKAMEQVAEELAEVGVNVSVEPWKRYPGKYEIATRYNLPVSLVKVVEHSVKYGAVLPCSVAQVKEFYVDDDEDEEETHNWPSVAKEVKKHAEKGLIDDVDEALQTLRDVFKEMREVVTQMAEALLGDYYEAVHSGGWMENACGVTFAKHKYEPGHEQRSKVMAWALQGLEAAFCHSLTILSADSEAFSVVANEHDGLIIRKDTDSEGAFQEALSDATQKAREKSGFHLAEFVEKPFADEEDVQALYGDEGEPSEEPSEEASEGYHSEEHQAADVPAEVPAGGGDGISGDGAAGEPVLAEAQDEEAGKETRDDGTSDRVVCEDDHPGPGTIVYKEGMPDSIPDTPDPPSGSSQRPSQQQHEQDDVPPDQSPASPDETRGSGDEELDPIDILLKAGVHPGGVEAHYNEAGAESEKTPPDSGNEEPFWKEGPSRIDKLRSVPD
jgi:hypothetical protein